jgi:hypothetical protein
MPQQQSTPVTDAAQRMAGGEDIHEYDASAGALAVAIARLVREMAFDAQSASIICTLSRRAGGHVMDDYQVEAAARAATAAASKARRLLRLAGVLQTCRTLSARADQFMDDDRDGYDAAIEILGRLADVPVDDGLPLWRPVDQAIPMPPKVCV